MWDIATPVALLLLPLPFLAQWLLPPRQELGGALRLPESVRAHFPEHEGERASATRRMLLPWLLWIAIVIALTGPRVVVEAARAPASGREIMFALDLSGSMVRR